MNSIMKAIFLMLAVSAKADKSKLRLGSPPTLSSSQCQDLGETAAEIIVFANVCTPEFDSQSNSIKDYKETCRQIAYGICEGEVSAKINQYCSDVDVNSSELLDLMNKCEDQVDSMVGRSPTRRPTRRPTDRRPSEECVDDDRPRPVRNGQRFRFNLERSDAQCTDSNSRVYEWGQFNDVRNFSACAELCVNDVPDSLAFDGNFRGYDYDCDSMTCNCLYDAGTLDSRNGGRFDRTNRNEPGQGSITGTSNMGGVYCGKLVGAELLEDVVAEA